MGDALRLDSPAASLGLSVKDGEKARDKDSKSQSAVLSGVFCMLGTEVYEKWREAVPGVQCGRLRRYRGGGGTTQRREAQWLRRVCAGDLNEVDHDCAFGGVTSWAAFPGISLSHLLVEPLPGEVGLWVSDGGGVEGSGPGLMKLLLLAREDSVQV